MPDVFVLQACWLNAETQRRAAHVELMQCAATRGLVLPESKSHLDMSISSAHTILQLAYSCLCCVC